MGLKIVGQNNIESEENMKRDVLFVSVVFLLAMFHSFTAFALERADKVYLNDIKVFVFYTGGDANGFFRPGIQPEMILSFQNETASVLDCEVALSVTDYDGEPLETKKLVFADAAPGKEIRTIARLTAPKKLGYFFVTASFYGKGKLNAVKQAGFIVTEPMAKRDPFFSTDGPWSKILNGMRMLGVGSMFIRFDAFGIQKNFGTWEKKFKWWMERGDGKLLTETTDFKKYGQLNPTPPKPTATSLVNYDEVARRYKKGFFPLSDETLLTQGRLARFVAEKYKGQIDTWIIRSELDGHVRAKTKFSKVPGSMGGACNVLSTYTTLVRQFAMNIKRGNPDAEIAVLGIYGGDFFNSRPPFLISRLVLSDLADIYDYVCIDAYNGNWNAANASLTPPEDGLRDYLMAASALSEELSGKKMVMNAERGYALDYFDPLDSSVSRQIADYNARSFIINRSTPSPMFALHMGGMQFAAEQVRKGLSDEKKLRDMGMWKVVPEIKRWTYGFIPRPGLLGFTVAARELAFVSDAREIIYENGVYIYCFTAQDGKQVAALWSKDESITAMFNLPASVLTDFQGNKTALKAGTVKLKLNGSPIYLRFTIDRNEAMKRLNAAEFPDFIAFAGEGRRTLANSMLIQIVNRTAVRKEGKLYLPNGNNIEIQLPPHRISLFPVKMKDTNSGNASLLLADGARVEVPMDYTAYPAKFVAKEPKFDGAGEWFRGIAPIELKTPDDIYPKSALQPEHGLFLFDGSDISAKLYLAWDMKNLYIGADIMDDTHLQRYSGATVWKEDSFQFIVSGRIDSVISRLQKNSLKNNLSDRDFNFTMALTSKKRQEFYLYASPKGGIRAGGPVKFPMNIRHDKTGTLYEAAIPWSFLKIKPGVGYFFRFAAVIWDNNRVGDKGARYRLQFGSGLAGGQNASGFVPVIMRK
jgi:hypothetical protein